MVHNTGAEPGSGFGSAQFGRRQFLWTAAVGAAAVGAAATLAGCGGGSGPQQQQGPAGPGGPAKQGGALRLGAQGGASTDTLDGQNGLTNADFNRIYQLYDQLVVLDAQGQPQLSMAKSITPNSDGTQWTIVIPDGVTTHRGKPFTADDVLFSLNRIVSMKYPGATSLGPVDLASSKVANPTTLLVALSPAVLGVARDVGVGVLHDGSAGFRSEESRWHRPV